MLENRSEAMGKKDMTWKHIYVVLLALLAARYTVSHSLAVEVPGAALVGSPPHPPLHHRHLVHLGRRQARVEALLARDGAKSGGSARSRSARPEGELDYRSTLPGGSELTAVFACLCSFLLVELCHVS